MAFSQDSLRSSTRLAQILQVRGRWELPDVDDARGLPHRDLWEIRRPRRAGGLRGQLLIGDGRRGLKRRSVVVMVVCRRGGG